MTADFQHVGYFAKFNFSVLFSSQAETVSKISIVFAFSHVKAFVSKIELAI